MIPPTVFRGDIIDCRAVLTLSRGFFLSGDALSVRAGQTGVAIFVAAMENVLDVYTAAPTVACSLVCLDEFSKQLLSEVVGPITPRPANGDTSAQPLHCDAEYVREGSASAFMLAMAHLGKREVFIGKDGRRTALGYAEAIEHLCDNLFPEAEKIVVVMDNLNTHNEASLYKCFPPEKARRLVAKLEVHYAPEHGSWLNIAEIEISLLSRSALAKRIGSLKSFRDITLANVIRRNESPHPIQWQFTTADARIKLARFYPDLPPV